MLWQQVAFGDTTVDATVRTTAQRSRTPPSIARHTMAAHRISFLARVEHIFLRWIGDWMVNAVVTHVNECDETLSRVFGRRQNIFADEPQTASKRTG